MGTWAIHSLGNDEAADFPGDLIGQNGLGSVQEAIVQILAMDGYLKAREAQ